MVNLFSQVRNKEVDIPVWNEHPFDDEHFRTKWYIVPVKDNRSLHVTFPIPDLHQQYQAEVMPSFPTFHAISVRFFFFFWYNNDMLILSL